MFLQGYIEALCDMPKGLQATVANPYLPPRLTTSRRKKRHVVREERTNSSKANILDSSDQGLVPRPSRLGVLVAISLNLFGKEIG